MNRFKLFTILMGVLIVASMTSCNKDGVYTPKKQILRMYNSSTISDKHMTQAWDWDGKLLKSIDFYTSSGSLDWTENFTYKSNRLIRVDDYLNSEYTTYEYDGKFLKSANYYSRNALEATTNYAYEKGKLVKVTVTYYDAKSKAESHLASSMMPFPVDVMNVINKVTTKVLADKSQKDVSVVNWELTWTGDNITKMVGTSNGVINTIALQYDDKNNPTKGFQDLYAFEMTDNLTLFSKNNITNLVLTYSDGENLVINYSYQYDDQGYPTMRIGNYVDDDYQWIDYFEYK